MDRRIAALVIGRQHKLACAVRGDVDGPRLQRDGPMLREPAVGRVDREAGELGRVAASRIQKLAVRADRQRERPAGYRDLPLRGERAGVGVNGQHRYRVTYGSPIFKAVPKKQCKALYRALTKSLKSPESAVGEGSGRSNVEGSVAVPQ